MAKFKSNIITLLTDFGIQDTYVGIMKGVITGINPQATIIDLTHNIPPQDVFQGAYSLLSAYKFFPEGTVHMAVVDPGVGSKRDIISVETRDFVFLVPNNGLLSFIIQEEKPERITRVTNEKYFLPSPSNTFHGRDIFSPVAAHLSLGLPPQSLGTQIQQLELFTLPSPTRKNDGTLEGEIISIDIFGNLITNITKEHIKDFNTSGTMVRTIIGKKKVTGLRHAYSEVPTGSPLTLFGSTGFLEISLNQGNAQEYFRAKRGSKVTIY